ncbi:ImmA/IrrE family metallo-endopeptidase [Arthrobacter sp. VKM Ac-2550]|uniref:ImmA/IrrE family metallo-endopeptidase n=1 Tax=Crystallibacter permensis TaxID=1938888 RepID=UPI002226F90F|nr:ImmA/IrrE family metallo-endopeptidase [Arthrobacter sp. VKM Ac-2550]MCW2132940.1 protein of unknown function (DUF955) [Arthrobacter sp. VKM Ac-2550]
MDTPPDIVFRHLPEGLAGHYDHKTREIVLDPRHPRRTVRPTVVHEMVHHNLDHMPVHCAASNTAREIMVESMASRYLICFSALLDAYMTFDSIEDMAEHLEVDLGAIYARFGSLTALEQTILAACGRHCKNMWAQRESAVHHVHQIAA